MFTLRMAACGVSGAEKQALILAFAKNDDITQPIHFPVCKFELRSK